MLACTMGMMKHQLALADVRNLDTQFTRPAKRRENARGTRKETTP